MYKKIFFLCLNIFSIQSSSTIIRDISTDSMLELALINYDRYHTTECARHTICAKSFYTQSVNSNALKRQNGGVLFTTYMTLTNALWFGINTALMQTKTNDIIKGGVDAFQFKFAYDIFKLDDDDAHGTIYLVGTAPGNIRPHDGSFGFGLNGDIIAFDAMHGVLDVQFDMKYRYIFNKNAPGNTIDFWTALHLPIDNFHGEFGYDFWWRQNKPARITASSNKIYLDFGYSFQQRKYSALLAIGAAYELGNRHALDQYNLWLTANFNF